MAPPTIPVPAKLVLDARAEYIADGDTVLVAVYVLDPDQELGFPGYVREGTCSLLYRNQVLLTIDFDRRFGNGESSEGDFVFQFSHPPVQTDMRIRVEVQTDPIPGHPNLLGSLSRTVPVTRADDPYIPLTEQLDTGPDANNELRSKLRLEEGL